MAGTSAFSTVTTKDVLIVKFVVTSILDAFQIQEIGTELKKIAADPFLPKVVIDLSHVQSLSSAMIGVLISLNAEAGRSKTRIVHCGLRPELRKLFKITNIHQLFQVYDNQDAALNALGVSAGA